MLLLMISEMTENTVLYVVPIIPKFFVCLSSNVCFTLAKPL